MAPARSGRSRLESFQAESMTRRKTEQMSDRSLHQHPRSRTTSELELQPETRIRDQSELTLS